MLLAARRATLAAVGLAAVVAAPVARAQNPEKLSVHGYLTQGYAASDTGLVMGIPYAQLGAHVLEPLTLNAQGEMSRVQLRAIPGSPDLRLDFNRDYALGANWTFGSNLLLKVEGHQTRGYNVEQIVNYLGAPLRGRYFITSFSASF